MYRYKAKLIRVVDGDTADVMIDLGFDTWIKSRLRFKDIDTWEKRTKDLEEKKKGILASEYTEQMLSKNNGEFILQSYGKGKFGRVLAEIFINGEETSLNKLLIENGHATSYDSGSKN
jgi:micrococcal nuclease